MDSEGNAASAPPNGPPGASFGGWIGMSVFASGAVAVMLGAGVVTASGTEATARERLGSALKPWFSAVGTCGCCRTRFHGTSVGRHPFLYRHRRR